MKDFDCVKLKLISELACIKYRFFSSDEWRCRCYDWVSVYYLVLRLADVCREAFKFYR